MFVVSTEGLVEGARRLNSFAIHLLRGLHEVDARSGLTPSRLSALSVLHFAGPRSLGRLARDEEVTSATMSRLVDALCELGLAVRSEHADNARMVTESAVPACSARMGAAAGRRTTVIAEALGDLSPEARRAVLAATPHLADLERCARERARADGRDAPEGRSVEAGR
jgi:DNA-binding MarR family transcriptional regulator